LTIKISQEGLAGVKPSKELLAFFLKKGVNELPRRRSNYEKAEGSTADNTLNEFFLRLAFEF